MLNRIFIAITIIATLYVLFKLTRVRQMDEAQRKAASLSLTTTNQSKLLYFSSASCSQCRGQESILNQILEDLALFDVTLQKYNIENHPVLAKQWGIKTLPTTILLSNTGKVKQINNGLISTTTLLSQLHQLQT